MREMHICARLPGSGYFRHVLNIGRKLFLSRNRLTILDFLTGLLFVGTNIVAPTHVPQLKVYICHVPTQFTTASMIMNTWLSSGYCARHSLRTQFRTICLIQPAYVVKQFHGYAQGGYQAYRRHIGREQLTTFQ